MLETEKFKHGGEQEIGKCVIGRRFNQNERFMGGGGGYMKPVFLQWKEKFD